MKEDPANVVERCLGGPSAVAKLVRKDASSVSRWKLPKEKGGSEGRVPLKNLFKIWCELIKAGAAVSLEQIVFTSAERIEIDALRTDACVGSSSQNPAAPSSPQTLQKVGVTE